MSPIPLCVFLGGVCALGAALWFVSVSPTPVHHGMMTYAMPQASTVASNAVSASQTGVPQDDLLTLHTPVSPSMRLVVDRSFHEQDRLRPLVDGSVVGLTPADVVALRRILRDPGEGDTMRNEAANHLRREEIRQVAEDCILVLQQAGESPRFRSFAMQHLGMLWLDGQIRDPSHAAMMYPVLIGALRDRDHEVQREALWALTCGHDTKAMSTMTAWLQNPDVRYDPVRDLCVRIVGHHRLMALLPEVRLLAHHPASVIRATALTTLGQCGDVSSRMVMTEAIQATDLQVSSAARRALLALDGATTATIATP